MLKNYLKSALRNLERQKLFTLINVTGLALGMALFILASLYSDFHFSFDRFSEDADRVYVVTKITPLGKGVERHEMFCPIPLLPLMANEFPEIEEITRHIPTNKQIMRYGDKKFYEGDIWIVDPNFITFFSFKLHSGNPETVLQNRNSIVLTKPMAIKYFGDKNPMGEVLTVGEYHHGYTVTGVLDDLPLNLSFEFDFLTSSVGVTFVQDWNTTCTSFLKIHEGVSNADLEEKFPAFLNNYVPVFKEKKQQIYIFPMVDVHLGSMGINSPFSKTTPVQFYMMMAIAVALLIVVSINFMNLSTARYFNRAKEVGLRKVVGARRSQLIKQFLGESLLLSLMAFPLALVLFELMRPAFIAFIGGKIDLTLWRDPYLIFDLLGVAVFVGIAAGSYPAFFLSSFRPTQVLKDNIQKGRTGARARKILVVSQFSLAMILIIFTMVANKQMDYLLDVDLGYDRDNVIILSIDKEAKDNVEPLKQELLNHPKIRTISTSPWYPVDWAPRQAILPEGEVEDNVLIMNAYPVHYDYFETLKMKIVKGRSFSREYADENNFIISETAARWLGWEDPIGKTLTMGKQKGRIIGIAEEFHFNHVFMNIAPSILYLNPEWTNLLFIKTSAVAGSETRDYIEERWNAIMPDVPFESTTLDFWFTDNVRSTTKISKIFNVISILSIFIACLGLIGLASYTTEQRTKEIGVRKVLGATVNNILKMLISDFLVLIIVANLIAFPAAYIFSKLFLEWAWVYKTDIGITVFIIAIALSLFSAIISVISQTLKAALANPVESLRYE